MCVQQKRGADDGDDGGRNGRGQRVARAAGGWVGSTEKPRGQNRRDDDSHGQGAHKTGREKEQGLWCGTVPLLSASLQLLPPCFGVQIRGALPDF
jgi:hypothetical protein